jgi:hypothetical protein
MRSKTVFIAVALFAALLSSSCGYNYMIQGRVVDAVTKKPIQGVVVAIHWYRYQWMSYIIPLNSGHETVADADDITDENGSFTIPRYYHITTGGHDLVVYKEGYICWYNKERFNPDAKTPMQWVLRRKDPGVSDGMVIELEPKNREGFPVYEHAKFVTRVGTQVRSTEFWKATIKESKLETEYYKKRIKRHK